MWRTRDFFLMGMFRSCSQVRAQRVENTTWSNVSMKSHRCWLRSELPCGIETWRSVVVTWCARFLWVRENAAADSNRHRFKTNYVNPVSWIKHYLWLIRGLIQISRANRFNRVIKIRMIITCVLPPLWGKRCCLLVCVASLTGSHTSDVLIRRCWTSVKSKDGERPGEESECAGRSRANVFPGS